VTQEENLPIDLPPCGRWKVSQIFFVCGGKDRCREIAGDLCQAAKARRASAIRVEAQGMIMVASYHRGRATSQKSITGAGHSS
jgi:hypothetical protein